MRSAFCTGAGQAQAHPGVHLPDWMHEVPLRCTCRGTRGQLSVGTTTGALSVLSPPTQANLNTHSHNGKGGGPMSPTWACNFAQEPSSCTRSIRRERKNHSVIHP